MGGEVGITFRGCVPIAVGIVMGATFASTAAAAPNHPQHVAQAPAPGAQPPPPPPPGQSSAPAPPPPRPPPEAGGQAPAAQDPVLPPPRPKEPDPPPVELFLTMGYGDALFCEDDDPDGACPVDGGFAGSLGGGWRISRTWAIGLELASWTFGVSDKWRGELEDDATDVEFSAAFIAPYARVYFLQQPQAYFQFGLGFGSVSGKASNDNDTFEVTNSGIVVPLALGFEWQLADIFRLGPQVMAYIQSSSRHCETFNGDETCRDANRGTRDDGEKVKKGEENAAPWRLSLVGTFTFGD